MTIKELTLNKLIIEKSEFITYLNKVFSVEEANLFLREIKKKHFDATHNCFAYIIGDDMEIQKCSDDAEPSKTAGLPILNVLKKQNITNTICIVTRYFGGKKLGTGGLIRAYGNSCTECLKLGKFLEKISLSHLEISIDYTLIGIVERYIRENSNLIKTEFLSNVTYFVSLVKEKKESFMTEIINLSKGKVHMDEKKESFEYIEV